MSPPDTAVTRKLRTPATTHKAGRGKDPDATRANILDVARREFVEHGFSGARVDAIAARTKTSKRMLYYYFGGKDALYREVLRASYEDIRAAEQALDLGGLPPDRALAELVRFTVGHHAAQPDFIRLVMIENIHHGRYVRQLEAIRELNAGAVAMLDGILSEGRGQGLFRPDVQAIDLHWLISALAFFAVSNQATFGWIFESFLAGSRPAEPERFAQEVVLGFVLN